MQCPQCAGILKESQYEDIPVHTCSHCGGEFMTGRALVDIVRIREQSLPTDMQQALADAKPFAGIPEAQKQRALNCPSCNCPMTVINYCGDSGVFVDRCDACHGFWLDHDELEQIQVLMQRWSEDAPITLRSIAAQLEQARKAAAQSSQAHFRQSRFAFINALINRFLDAA